MHIEFTEGEDRITLEGPTKDVQMVQSQIEVTVADLVSHVDVCVSLDRAIMVLMSTNVP